MKWPTIILALDLATNTGVCAGRGDQLPSLSHVRMPSTGDDVGRFLCFYRDWFLKALDEHTPSVVVFESPILPATTSLATVRKLAGLAGVTEMICNDEGIDCREVAGATVKLALTGSGRAKKPDMVRACRAYGLNPHTYIKDGEEASDEADAFGAWLASVRQIHPDHAARWTPLFAGSAA